MFKIVLKKYKTRYICSHCLGRMFSLLASDTTNHERGHAILLVLTMENHGRYLLGNDQEKSQALENLKILAENAHFLPAQKVLEREAISYFKKDQDENCYLCNNIFSNLQNFIEKAIEALKGIEFENFLVGTSLDSEIENREDEFKSEFNILEAEAFKSHFNREIGKRLSKLLGVPSKFDGADVLIIYHLHPEAFHVEVKIRSLFIHGKYQKLIRGIPQTKWICLKCEGQGCEECNYLGKRYP
ncbi:MAG: tRNA pseudouridine(54/55) synthase Pus10, partial [Promethearchaeota archaeon]